MAEFLFHKGSPTYLQPENADVMNISQFMAQNLRQAPPPLAPPTKHTFEISEGESVEIEKIVAAEKKDGQLFYKVKWVKYTWEAEESIQHLPHLIDGYWREHFYQNINQAVIDTGGITAVNTTESTDLTRNKSVVVNQTDNRTDAQKAVVAVQQPSAGNVAGTATVQLSTTQGQGEGTKITTVSGDQATVVNGAVLSAVTTGNVGESNDVILEFQMPQNKVDHTYQNRLITVGTTSITGDKKSRRAYPLERKYICTVCQKAFDRNTSLTRHMLVHTREKPFKCQLCDKAFSQNAHLKRHILIHIGQKSYQCNKCGKMFIEKGGLARHEATHSTDKPWVCNQCGKAFVLNEYLQRHLFLHTGQKPYQCNECGRLFADGSSWRAHKLTHNKEKKYKCPVCQKMLKCKRNFKKHVQAHSEDKDLKHKCEICHDRFPNKKALRDHYRKAKKYHRCKTCKKFLKSRARYLAHAEFHDPDSDKYDPTAKIAGEEFDDEKFDDTISEDDSGKSDDEENPSDNQSQPMHHHHQTMVIPASAGGGSMVHNQSVVVGVPNAQQQSDEILSKILASSGKVVQQSDQTTGSAVSALTALYLKAEGGDDQVPAHLQVQTDNESNSQVIQAIGSSIEGSDIASNLQSASQQVDLSIQLASGETVQHHLNATESMHHAMAARDAVQHHLTPTETIQHHMAATENVHHHLTTNETVQQMQYTNVSNTLDLQQMPAEQHLETLAGPNPIDNTGTQLNTPDNSQTNENVVHADRQQAQETIILITQNNDVDMQQMREL
ncbi:uncharacterized protein [Clytia hemisphaerica]